MSGTSIIAQQFTSTSLNELYGLIQLIRVRNSIRLKWVQCFARFFNLHIFFVHASSEDFGDPLSLCCLALR